MDSEKLSSRGLDAVLCTGMVRDRRTAQTMNASDVWALLPPFVQAQCTIPSPAAPLSASKAGVDTFVAVCTSHRYDAPMESVVLTPVAPGRSIQQNGGNVDDDLRLQAVLKTGDAQPLFDALCIADAFGHNLAVYVLTTTIAVAAWNCDVKQLRSLFGLKPDAVSPGEADLLFRQFGCTDTIAGLGDSSRCNL